MQLKGATFLVTGGGSGLGAATAREIVAGGGNAIIADVNEQAGKSLASELGQTARFVKTDVVDARSVNAAIKEAVGTFGSLRGAVNCAGVGIAARVLAKEGPHDLTAFSRVVEINLIGTFNVIRLAAAAIVQAEPLADGERGVIINTASVAAFDGQIGQAAYSASKGGVVGMTLPIARELAQLRHPRIDNRSWAVRHADDGGTTGRSQEVAGPAGAVSTAARQTERVRASGAAHDRKPDAQRRDGAPGRGDPHGAEMIGGRASRPP